MSTLQYTTNAQCLTVRADDEEGIVTAIVSVYGVLDSHNTRIAAGAFDASILARMPSLVHSHDHSQSVGVTLSIESLLPNDKRLPEAIRKYGGLLAKGKFDKDITDSWQEFLAIRAGHYKEYSVGFIIDEKEVEDDGTILITRATLIEWSPVIYGSNPLTQTVNVRAGTISEQTSTVCADFARVIEGWENKHLLKERSGRMLSQTNVVELETALDSLRFGVQSITELLKKAKPVNTEQLKARIRMAKIRSQIF